MRVGNEPRLPRETGRGPAGSVLRLALPSAAVWVIPATATAREPFTAAPLPVRYEVAGDAMVLAVAVVVATVLWRRPRYQRPRRERVVSWPWLRPAAVVLSLLGLVMFVVALVSGFIGPADTDHNLLPVTVFVVFWLVVPLLSGLVGDLYPVLGPWRRLTFLFGFGEDENLLHVERVGYWPAVVGFTGFGWLLLVWPDRDDPRWLAVATLVYTVYLLVYSYLVGRDTGSEAGDAFSAYNRLVGAMAPFGHTDGGEVVYRGWLRGLPEVRERPGLVAMVSAMVGVGLYAGLSTSAWWQRSADGFLVRLVAFVPAEWRDVAGHTLALVGTILVVWLVFLVACWATWRLGGIGGSVSETAQGLAHVLVPVAFGLVMARYMTWILLRGQLLVGAVSDPFAVGWNLFGTAGREVVSGWLRPDIVWWIQVAVLVGAHVVATVFAHDRVLALSARPRRTQLPMLVLSALFAMAGLSLLAS